MIINLWRGLAYLSLIVTTAAFAPGDAAKRTTTYCSMSMEASNGDHDVSSSLRRSCLVGVVTLPLLSQSALAEDEGFYSPKFVQEYGDFTGTKEGWSYRDVKVGQGEVAKPGDRVVFDWSGYTIGYFGRPFQAKGGPQGGAFEKEQDYFRTVIGSGKIVKGLEEAFLDMKPGSIRQVIVPYGPLSYPSDDAEHDRVGPKPTSFSGLRALNFVLENPRVDRTLLFNVKVIRVDKPNGKGGFIRG